MTVPARSIPECCDHRRLTTFKFYISQLPYIRIWQVGHGCLISGPNDSSEPILGVHEADHPEVTASIPFHKFIAPGKVSRRGRPNLLFHKIPRRRVCGCSALYRAVLSFNSLPVADSHRVSSRWLRMDRMKTERMKSIFALMDE
jgi:hypothetical protein